MSWTASVLKHPDTGNRFTIVIVGDPQDMRVAHEAVDIAYEHHTGTQPELDQLMARLKDRGKAMGFYPPRCPHCDYVGGC